MDKTDDCMFLAGYLLAHVTNVEVPDGDPKKTVAFWAAIATANREYLNLGRDLSEEFPDADAEVLRRFNDGNLMMAAAQAMLRSLTSARDDKS